MEAGLPLVDHGQRAAVKAERPPVRLASIPPGREAITHLDLDLTVACNLRCDYCFKEKADRHLDLETALDAVIWLIYSSGRCPEISIVMIGGEPLLRFDLMRRLVPFAERRAAQHGKTLRFSMTTNGTIVNDEILAFCKHWGVGFHTSIDGHPEVQDRHRKLVSGKGTSAILERNLPRILEIRPSTTSRSTIMPDSVSDLYQSFLYFLGLGYSDMAFVSGAPAQWNEAAIAEARQQFELIGDHVISSFRQGRYLKVKYIDCMCTARAQGRQAMPRPCGVGRGMALVDVDGALWPCHRWNKQDPAIWSLGSIYDGGFNESARDRFYQTRRQYSSYRECAGCVARPICAGGCPAENLEETGDAWHRHETSCRLHEIFAGVGARVHDVLQAESNQLFMKTYYADAAGGDGGSAPGPALARGAGAPSSDGP